MNAGISTIGHLSYARVRTLALAFTLATTAAACGGGTPAPPVDGRVTCDARADAGGMCMEQLDPLDDTRRLSLVGQCTENGGRLVDSCPTENLVGVCEIEKDTSQAWTLNARTRVHHYLHPDVATPDAIEGIAERCGGPSATWTPAPDPAE